MFCSKPRTPPHGSSIHHRSSRKRNPTTPKGRPISQPKGLKTQKDGSVKGQADTEIFVFSHSCGTMSSWEEGLERMRNAKKHKWCRWSAAVFEWYVNGEQDYQDPRRRFSISEPACHKANVLRLMSEAVGELKTWPTPRCRVIPLMLQQRRFDSPKQQHWLIF